MTDALMLCGDMRAVLATMDPESVDAVICDPPYELTNGKRGGTGAASVNPNNPAGRSRIGTGGGGFMGCAWDATGVSFDPETWRAALRVAKPGAHLAAFGGSRTWHRIAVAIEDAGWDIRDSLIWWYAQGFPKSLDVSKAIDANARGGMVASKIRHFMQARGETPASLATKAGLASASSIVDWTEGGHVPSEKNWNLIKGALLVSVDEEAEYERAVLARASGGIAASAGSAEGYGFAAEYNITAPATDAARQWAGWGTALKPAFEPIILARKPLAGTVAANVQKYGTGAINIDGCRVGKYDDATAGRWPPNMLVSHADACAEGAPCAEGCPAPMFGERLSTFPAFYAPKASRAEREAGCDALPARVVDESREEGAAGTNHARSGVKGERKNHHPTVKPISVMRWLSRLLCPPGGLILDPFAGSGTTGCAAVIEGCDFLGVELDPAHVAIAEARIAHAKAGGFKR